MKNMKLLWKKEKLSKNHETILKGYGNQPKAINDQTWNLSTILHDQIFRPKNLHTLKTRKSVNDHKNNILQIQDAQSGLLVHGSIETDVRKCGFSNYVSFP